MHTYSSLTEIVEDFKTELKYLQLALAESDDLEDILELTKGIQGLVDEIQIKESQLKELL